MVEKSLSERDSLFKAFLDLRRHEPSPLSQKNLLIY